jgi:hypothetical protein
VGEGEAVAGWAGSAGSGSDGVGGGGDQGGWRIVVGEAEAAERPREDPSVGDEYPRGPACRPGEVLVAARSALLDALIALGEHAEEVTLIGAQAIYLHTGAADVALAETTKDSDLVLDPRHLADDPLLEEAIAGAGFHQNLEKPQPGAWLSPTGVPSISWSPKPSRARRAAAPAASHPMRTTRRDGPSDRLLVAVGTDDLARSLRRLLDEELSAVVTRQAVEYLTEMFADGPSAGGSSMAGRAETLIGDPDTVSRSVSILAADLTAAIRSA